MAGLTVGTNEPDFVEESNLAHTVFLEKLGHNDAQVSDFHFWLSSAALNLCVILNNAKLKDKLIHADQLVKEVKRGFEREDLLRDLSEEEIERVSYSKALFAKTFKE